jgi:hypothetical protein
MMRNAPPDERRACEGRQRTLGARGRLDHARYVQPYPPVDGTRCRRPARGAAPWVTTSADGLLTSETKRGDMRQDETGRRPVRMATNACETARHAMRRDTTTRTL